MHNSKTIAFVLNGMKKVRTLCDEVEGITLITRSTRHDVINALKDVQDEIERLKRELQEV